MNKLHFVFAGAGSGKTHFLTTRLARLLMTADRQLLPEQILVSTFTKAAATEIRDRVQQALAAEGGSAELLMALRSSEINTIHSLGLSLIKRHWFRLGISPDPQVMEEESGDAFIRRMLEELPLDPVITNRLGELNRMLNLFTKKGFGSYHPFAWREQLAKLIELALANGIKDLSEKSLSCKESLNWLNTLYQNNGNRPEFQEGLPMGNLGINQQLLDDSIRELLNLPNISEAKGNIQSALDRVPAIKKFSPRRYADFVKLWISFGNNGQILKVFEKNAAILRNGSPILVHTPRLIQLLSDITRDADFLNHCQEYIHLIFMLADTCLNYYKDFKKTNNLIDFSDMERYFRDLLTLEEVREEIRSSIRLVMVDEFQDCSPLQVEIFRELALLAEDNYWVGDPKQAIYGFRGTDSGLIRQIVQQLSRGEGAFAELEVSFGMLKSGFRSVPELVSLSNTMFTELLASQNQPLTVHKDLVKGDEKSAEFIAWKEATFGGNSHAIISVEDLIQLFASRQPIDEPHLLRLDMKPDSETPEDGILLAVKHLLNPENNIRVGAENGNEKRAVRPSDIAILCRDNAHVHAFVKTLKENGIPVSQQGADFFNEPEFRLMHNLFFLVQKPWDSLARTNVELLLGNISREQTGAYLQEQHKLGLERKVFAVEGIEETDGDRLEKLFLNGVHPAVVECYRQSQVLGVGEIARRLVSEMDLSFRVSGWVGPVQRRRNLQHFISLCDKFQESAAKAGKPATVNDFLIWLQSNKEDLKSAAAGDADAVNVLTMHKAKGLEWPIVIPVGKPGTLKNLDKIDELYQSCFCPAENGSDKYIRFAFNPFGKTTKFPGNASQHLSTEELNALFNGNREEHLRLMYVTTTRARDLLVDLNFKPSSKGPKYSGFSSLFLTIPETVSGNFPEFTTARPGTEIAAAAQANQVYFTPPMVEAAEGRPFFLQPSQMQNPGNTQFAIEKVKDFGSRISIDMANENAWNGLQDRKDELLGNLLHAVFYLEDIQHLNTDDFQRMAGGLFKITEENLAKLKKLHSDFFGWCREITSEKCRIHRELPLEYRDNGQVWTGTADLVLDDDSGLFLIDYKSYQGGEAAITGNGEHSARIYYAQLSAYRSMLKASMEDPSAFREMMIFYPMSGLVVKLTRN